MGNILQTELDYLISQPSGFIALLITDAKQYAKTNEQVLQYLAKEKGKKGIYITVNRPYHSIVDSLGKVGITEASLFFIDAITKSVQQKSELTPNCLFINSPQGLTEMSIALAEGLIAMKGHADFVFLDSVSTLLLYNQAGTVAKFVHFLSAKIRENKMSGVFVSLQKETDERIISQLSQFCDKVIVVE